MIKRSDSIYSLELPDLGPRKPAARSVSRPRRLLHQIEFFAGGGGEDLLEDEGYDYVGRASWSLAAHEGRPRDPRLRAAISAAASGWISDRAAAGS